MTKAAVCTHCMDVFSPYRNWETNRSWRWCQCGHTATRWKDGSLGLLEVSSLHGPDRVRVLGMNNAFLIAAIRGVPAAGHGAEDLERWRLLHDATCSEVPPTYLFHDSKRRCWAVVAAAGETSDIRFVDYTIAYHGDLPPAAAAADP